MTIDANWLIRALATRTIPHGRGRVRSASSTLINADAVGHAVRVDSDATSATSKVPVVDDSAGGAVPAVVCRKGTVSAAFIQ